MYQAQTNRQATRRGVQGVTQCLVVGGLLLWGAAAGAGNQVSAVAVSQSPGAAVSASSPALNAAVDRRVALLTRELGLDATQQARLRELLLAQRAQVAQVWSELSMDPALRVGKTQSISEWTADQIRSLLHEPQRKKYPASRSAESANLPRADVDAWMKTDTSQAQQH